MSRDGSGGGCLEKRGVEGGDGGPFLFSGSGDGSGGGARLPGRGGAGWLSSRGRGGGSLEVLGASPSGRGSIFLGGGRFILSPLYGCSSSAKDGTKEMLLHGSERVEINKNFLVVHISTSSFKFTSWSDKNPAQSV